MAVHVEDNHRLSSAFPYPRYVLICGDVADSFHGFELRFRDSERDRTCAASFYATGVQLQSVIAVRWAFALLNHLSLIDLSSNHLTNLGFPALWAQLFCLRHLFLHNNRIESIDAVVGPLAMVPSLRHITLHGNPGLLGARQRLISDLPHLICIDDHIVADVERIDASRVIRGKFKAMSAATHIGHRVDLSGIAQLNTAIPLDDRNGRELARRYAALSPAASIQRVWRGFAVRCALNPTQQKRQQYRRVGRNRRPIDIPRVLPAEESARMRWAVATLRQHIGAWFRRERQRWDRLGDVPIVVLKKDSTYWCCLAYRLGRACAVNLDELLTVQDSTTTIQLIKHHSNPIEPETFRDGPPPTSPPQLESSAAVLLAVPHRRAAPLRSLGKALKAYCRSQQITDSTAESLRQQARRVEESLAAARSEAAKHSSSAERHLHEGRRAPRLLLLPAAVSPRMQLQPMTSITLRDPCLVSRLILCGRIHNAMRRVHRCDDVMPFYTLSDAQRLCSTVLIQALWRGALSRHRQARAHRSRYDGRIDPRYQCRISTLSFYVTRLQAHWRAVLAHRRARFLRHLRNYVMVVQRHVDPGTTATTALISVASLKQLIPPATVTAESAVGVGGNSHRPSQAAAVTWSRKTISLPGCADTLSQADVESDGGAGLSDTCRSVLSLPPDAAIYSDHEVRLMAARFPEIHTLRCGLEMGVLINDSRSLHSTVNSLAMTRSTAVISPPTNTTIRTGLVFCGSHQAYSKLPVFLRAAADPCAPHAATLASNPIGIVLLDSELAYFVTNAVAPQSKSRDRRPQVEVIPSLAISVVAPSETNPQQQQHAAGSGSSPSPARPITTTTRRSKAKYGARSNAASSKPLSQIAAGTSGLSVPAGFGSFEDRLAWIRRLVRLHPNGYLAVKFANRREAVRRRIALAALTYRPQDGSCVCFEPLDIITATAAAARIQNWWRSVPHSVEAVPAVKPLTTESTAVPEDVVLVDHVTPANRSETHTPEQVARAVHPTPTLLTCGRHAVPLPVDRLAQAPSIRHSLTSNDFRSALGLASQSQPERDDDVVACAGTTENAALVVRPVMIHQQPGRVGDAADRCGAAAEAKHVHHGLVEAARHREQNELAERRALIIRTHLESSLSKKAARIVQKCVQLEIQHDCSIPAENRSVPLVDRSHESNHTVLLAPVAVGKALVYRPRSAGVSTIHSHSLEHQLDIPIDDVAPAWAAFALPEKESRVDATAIAVDTVTSSDAAHAGPAVSPAEHAHIPRRPRTAVSSVSTPRASVDRRPSTARRAPSTLTESNPSAEDARAMTKALLSLEKQKYRAFLNTAVEKRHQEAAEERQLVAHRRIARHREHNAGRIIRIGTVEPMLWQHRMDRAVTEELAAARQRAAVASAVLQRCRQRDAAAAASTARDARIREKYFTAPDASPLGLAPMDDVDPPATAPESLAAAFPDGPLFSPIPPPPAPKRVVRPPNTRRTTNEAAAFREVDDDRPRPQGLQIALRQRPQQHKNRAVASSASPRLAGDRQADCYQKRFSVTPRDHGSPSSLSRYMSFDNLSHVSDTIEQAMSHTPTVPPLPKGPIGVGPHPSWADKT